MDKLILNEQQIAKFVGENAYEIPEDWFMARCIDGRYPNDPNLPALAIPGADAGDLAVIFATANDIGQEVDMEKAWETMVEVVGGVQNIRVHTDEHNKKQDEVLMGGCGHKNHMKTDPEGFGVTDAQVKFIRRKIAEAKKQGAQEVVLPGSHQEGAVLFVRGEKGVLPQYEFDTPQGRKLAQVFVVHQTLIDRRHEILAEKLITNGAFPAMNTKFEDNLNDMLFDITQKHILEIAGRLAKGLPIYEVDFEGGDFELESRGNV